MVTKEFLLSNGFEFRSWEDNVYTGVESQEGEYTLRNSNVIIRIGYSDLYKWNYEILNMDSHIRFNADCQDSISISDLQKLFILAKVKINLKKPVNLEQDYV